MTPSFRDHVEKLSDNELYELARDLHLRELTGFIVPERKLTYVRHQCDERSPDMFEKAFKDASAIYITILNNDFLYPKVTNIKNINRIDFMNETELNKLLKQFKTKTDLNFININTIANLLNNISGIVQNGDSIFCRAEGDSMISAGIMPGAYVIADSSKPANSGDIVIARVNGDYLIKRLEIGYMETFLRSANPKYPDIRITDGMDFQALAVVTSVIYKMK